MSKVYCVMESVSFVKKIRLITLDLDLALSTAAKLWFDADDSGSVDVFSYELDKDYPWFDMDKPKNIFHRTNLFENYYEED